MQVTNKENHAQFYWDLKKWLDSTQKDKQACEIATPARERTQCIAGGDDLELIDPKVCYHIGIRASI